MSAPRGSLRGQTPDPTLGTLVLGRYRLVRYLAKGGMGAIYLARAEGASGFARPVVIKRALRSGDEQTGRMFAREARILSCLRHPSILSIIDFAEEDGDYVMVLDYVHGYTLSEWSRYRSRKGGLLPVAHVVHAMITILEALDYAHSLADEDGKPLGIVHRDIKPSNMLIDVRGDVQLADFGIARTDNEVTETAITDVTLKGTLPYMAPELFAKGIPGRATDVYSAAVTLYSVISGVNPFAENDPAQTIGRVVQFVPDALAEMRADVPAALSAAIAIGLRKRPEERHASAVAFAQALRAALPGRAEDHEAAFRASVREDFEAADFHEIVGVDSLRRRADALAGAAPPPMRGSDDTDPNVAPLPPESLAASVQTSVLGRAAVIPAAFEAASRLASVPPEAPLLPIVVRTRRWPWAIAGGAVVASVAVTIAWAVWAGRAPPPAPAMVMVRGDVSIEGAGAASDAAVPAIVAPGTAANDASPAAVPDDAPDDAPDAPDAPARGPNRPPDLAAIVRRRQGAITACFEKHAASISGAPEMAFRFQVDARGRVTQAELVPDTLAPSPLGRCLIAVARATEFGPLRKPVTFRIPITVRRK